MIELPLTHVKHTYYVPQNIINKIEEMEIKTRELPIFIRHSPDIYMYIYYNTPIYNLFYNTRQSCHTISHSIPMPRLIIPCNHEHTQIFTYNPWAHSWHIGTQGLTIHIQYINSSSCLHVIYSCNNNTISSLADHCPPTYWFFTRRALWVEAPMIKQVPTELIWISFSPRKHSPPHKIIVTLNSIS